MCRSEQGPRVDIECEVYSYQPLTGLMQFIYGRTVDDCYRGCEELPRIWLELDDLMTDVMMKINHWAEWNEDAFNTTKFSKH